MELYVVLFQHAENGSLFYILYIEESPKSFMEDFITYQPAFISQYTFRNNDILFSVNHSLL